ncbi:multidrug efflux pump AcrAB, subunit B3 [Solemya velum gill symbiont]|uniref:Multidrug efflux pump AcrAB, subunit B3 n=1 Tax=Solemya velum gill symbiont TaxID=2340 RepID=A0A0B0H6U3_SOVGS|nr:efflux RND transporter permease subunit [Solemya velum gill symbiont]KHF24825.1 multidrug efflux pump AcrAB, subunit B3 [Solemya velum gill symbiont]
MSQRVDNNLDELKDKDLGIAGNTARAFINSPLSPLLYAAMLLMGIMGYLLIPRQEDPQISVPMVDLIVPYPGASAEQVSVRAIEPLERMMSEIKGVKHVYSASQRGMGMVTVQFEVGEEMNDSLVKVNDKIDSNMDKIPSGVSPPMVSPVGIDDVPVVTLTLWSKDLNQDNHPDVDDSQLRMLAHDILQNLNELPNTSEGFVVGGRKEVVKVEVLPEILAGYGISIGQVAQAIQTANQETQAGSVESGGTHLTVVTGKFLKHARDVSELIVGTFGGAPIHLRDVAVVTQGPEDASKLVAFYSGPQSPESIGRVDGSPAVTIAIAKQEGTNGVTVANAVLERVEELKGRVIPTNVDVFVTRNYGQTANDKVNELIFKLFVATSIVFALVLVAFRAFKPALVVTLVIPVVLLMTIFVAWLLGFTIDRVSLFALIFSIGILVDDAIVVIENIYRRWLQNDSTDMATAVDAVREVGNPTILATFTVIGALLPMGFVSGMMGPYMFPIPALGSVAMLISLFAAFVFTPWLAISGLFRPSMNYLAAAEEREHKEAERLEGMFRRILMPMIDKPAKRKMFNGILWLLLIFACSFFYFKWVAVKMLPLDNKPEFSVVIDMPEGTALPDTANLTASMAEKLRQFPEVTAIQTYVGTARPFDFNGMVRHYYTRRQPWQADIQVQLLDKNDRERTSHEIAVEARRILREMIKGTRTRIAVVEMPPGPPVLQSVVAEVHGPDDKSRREVARHLTRLFEEAPNLTDVDNYMREPYSYWRFEADREKASRAGVNQESINQNIAMALGSAPMGDVKNLAGHEPINIVLQVPFAERSQVTRLGDLPVNTATGEVVSLREFGQFVRMEEDEIIYHKDLRSVEYVVADVSGRLAAPVYGMMQVQDALAAANDGQGYVAPDGAILGNNIEWMGPPANDIESSFEWTGEWTVTYETFRDMGAAFMVALAVIYFLVVIEFGNFRIPAVIMAPIPLTLLGIIPAHAFVGAEFTATSMIGWIALAGIIVRNSILLVDFTIHEVRAGVVLEEAVIKACMTRTRPIVITALALVGGSAVILTDPIFQGMAISLAAGVLVSTVLTLIVIPLGTTKAAKALYQVAGVDMPDGSGGTTSTPAPAAAPVAPKRSFTDMAFMVWGKLIGAIFALISFFGILMNWLRLLLPKKKPPQAPPPAAPQPPAAPKPPPTPPPVPEAAPVPEPAPEPEPQAPAAEAEQKFVAEPEPVAETPKPVVEAPAPEPVAEAPISEPEIEAPAPEVVEPIVAEPVTAPEPKPEPEPEVVAPEPAAPVVEQRKVAEPLQADEDIIEVSQASDDDIDLLSAPIRPTSVAAAKSDSASQMPGATVPQPGKRRRRGIRLRDMPDESDDQGGKE